MSCVRWAVLGRRGSGGRHGLRCGGGETEGDASIRKTVGSLSCERDLAQREGNLPQATAWWAANDVWRSVPDPNPEFSKEQVQNLDALSALFDESEPNQRILKAEIARELGRFDECLLLLSYQFEPGYDSAVGFIRKLAEEKVRR